jgi:hypothetical protein
MNFQQILDFIKSFAPVVEPILMQLDKNVVQPELQALIEQVSSPDLKLLLRSEWRP